MLFNDNNNLKPRKRSYYPFSKNYPGKRGNSYDIGESRTRRKKEKRNRTVFYVCLVLLFVAVFIAASVFSKLSSRPIDSSLNGAASEFDGKFRALHMPEDALSGGIAFDLFKTKLNEVKANAVVIDFKNADGTLNYTSSVGTAASMGASAGAYENAEETVKQLKLSGYRIIARIYCYEDVLAASMLKGAAVTEADTVTVWLDDSAQNDGNPWLNPYSETAEKYLLSIISESLSVGADAVMLESVCFPDSNRAVNAYFAGENESVESRNSVLHSFVDKAAEICGDVPVIVSMNVDSALNGNASLYSGGMFDSGAVFDAVDFRTGTLSDGFAVGEQTYSAQTFTENSLIESAVPILQNKIEENYTTKAIIPIIDDPIYVSTLENLGINNYIIV